jgi:hypothetical protein
MQPIDLKARYSDTYRIQHEPAGFHEPGGRKDPWLYVISCRKLDIHVDSDTRLGLWWGSRKRLDPLCPKLELLQDATLKRSISSDRRTSPQWPG